MSDNDQQVTRRDFLRTTTASLSLAAAVPGALAASGQAATPAAAQPAAQRAKGLLLPQRNATRDLIDLSGFWQFQLDPKDEGEAARWFDRLPTPRTIAVPCSWNELFDDAHDYLGTAWYLTQTWVPARWKGSRVFLRVGSANYAAMVWLNGRRVTQHFGGHLPFVVDITDAIAWDRANVIGISVENKQ